jgi:hypothetical protein
MDRTSMLKLRFDSEDKSKDTNNASSNSSTSSSSEEIEEEEQKKIASNTKQPLSTTAEQNSSQFPIYQDYMPDDIASNVLVDLESTIEKVLEKLLAAKNNNLPATVITAESEGSSKKPAVTKRPRAKRARSESTSSADSNPRTSADDSAATCDDEDNSNSDNEDNVNMGGKRNKKSSNTKKERKSKPQKQKKTKRASSSSSSKTLAQVNKTLVGLQTKVKKALERRK